jgi:hypothetical protein
MRRSITRLKALHGAALPARRCERLRLDGLRIAWQRIRTYPPRQREGTW